MNTYSPMGVTVKWTLLTHLSIVISGREAKVFPVIVHDVTGKGDDGNCVWTTQNDGRKLLGMEE